MFVLTFSPLGEKVNTNMALIHRQVKKSTLGKIVNNHRWHFCIKTRDDTSGFQATLNLHIFTRCVQSAKTRLVIEVRSVNTSSYRGSNSRHSPPGITGFIPSGYRRVVEMHSSTHVDWLLSRSHFYNLIEDFDYIKIGRFDSYWFIFATCQVDSFTHSDSFYYNFQILGIRKNWKGPNIRSACRLQVYSSFKSSNLCG